MSSPTETINDSNIGSVSKEQKVLGAKVPSRYNLESQLFQDTYEVEFSSTKNVKSSVEDWIDVPTVDFEGQSGKSQVFPDAHSASVKHQPRHSLSAFPSFQGSGSNYSMGSSLTDNSHTAAQGLSLSLGSHSGSFRSVPPSQFSTPTHNQFSPTVFRNHLGMDQSTDYRSGATNGFGAPFIPPAPQGGRGGMMQGGGFFNSHESSMHSMSGYLSHNTSQSDMSMFVDDVPPDTMIFVVAFKTTCRDYVLGVRIPSVVKVGDKVIVSADRGEDMGTVTEIITYDQFLYQRFQLVRPLTSYFNLNKFVGRILRFASEREVRTLGMKAYDENEVVKYGVHLINHVYKLNMTIYDAEFQFDRHKLTIYYDCLGRVDFREFVKAVHVTFNARVWMEKVSGPAMGAGGHSHSVY